MNVKSMVISVCICGLFGTACTTDTPYQIVIAEDASVIERLAAKELRRYVYHRTDRLLSIVSPGDRRDGRILFLIANKDRDMIQDIVPLETMMYTDLSEQEYSLRSETVDGSTILCIVGGSSIGTLYGAYAYAEQLGVRFYLHGDVIPDEKIDLSLSEINKRAAPLFNLRGILPFHDFPEGPDWWNKDDYKAIFAQLPKMRMNFVGFHTYPERLDFNGDGYKAEPLVWIGPEDDINPGGTVNAGYPILHFHTYDSTWGYAPTKTSDFHYGASQLFETDNYGADYIKDITPWPHRPEENIALFNDVGELLDESFSLAQKLGIRTTIGTETPLQVPGAVRERLNPSDNVSDESVKKELYKGIFRRINEAHPLDYFWFWTPEGWTWSDPDLESVRQTERDMQLAIEAAQEVGASFQLATCGWVLGPPHDRTEFDRILPKNMPFSCINREVGMTPVEPAFRDIQGRPKWAIPWLEDDPALISPQLWVGRMRKDALDALEYGCTGLMGIHWRTRVLGPNVAALAQAAWDQDAWNRDQSEESERDLPADDFYHDWAESQFGKNVGGEIAFIFTRIDGGPLFLRGHNQRKANLPRGSMWYQGPGAIISAVNESVHVIASKEEISEAFWFIEDLENLRSSLNGAGNIERFDYWLNTFRFARATALLGFILDELDEVVRITQQNEDRNDQARTIREVAFPLRLETTALWEEMVKTLLLTVSNTGEMGTIANLEQHNLGKLNILGKHDSLLTALSEQPLPASTRLTTDYDGPLRVIVPTKRTLLEDSEDLYVRARILARQPVLSATLYWRMLGDISFKRLPMMHIARGVYQVELSNDVFLPEDIEYYIHVETETEEQSWPVTAPEINHSVVVLHQ